jgi:single-strand DNA-binding protein
MAGSINKVILVGNLGKDPESRQTQSGHTLTRFGLATSERWSDKSGERQERTTWHNIKAWGKLGELCGNYLRKGSKVYVEGRLETREDDQGRKFTDVVANDVVFLETRGSSSASSVSNPSPSPKQPATAGDAWGQTTTDAWGGGWGNS